VQSLALLSSRDGGCIIFFMLEAADGIFWRFVVFNNSRPFRRFPFFSLTN